MKRILLSQSKEKFSSLFVIVLLLTGVANPLQSQSLEMSLSTGYKFQVHNLPPTLCRTSGATTYYENTWWGNFQPYSNWALPFLEQLNVPLDVGSNHIFEARKTYTIILDIPYIGDLPAVSGDIWYMYGTKNGTKTEGTIYDYSTEESPGNMRFRLPVTFNEGTEDAFLLIPIRDGELPADGK